jgi:hypothetical protein
VAYGVPNYAGSPPDRAVVDPVSCRFWVRNDSVLTTTRGSLVRSTTQFVQAMRAASKHQGLSLMGLGRRGRWAWAGGGDLRSTCPRSLDELA